MSKGDYQAAPIDKLGWIKRRIAAMSVAVTAAGWTWLQTCGGGVVGNWLVQSVPPAWIATSIGILLCVIVYLLVSVLVLRKRLQSFFERIEPVPGQGYFLDPVYGELVCPRCLNEGKRAYLAEAGKEALFCQCCQNAYKVFSLE